MVLAWLVGALCVLAAAVVLVGLNPVARWRLRHLPGPRPEWLLGNMRRMGSFGKSHEALQRWAGQYGPCFRYFLGTRPCVVLSDPELVRQVSVKHFMQFHDRPPPQLENGDVNDRQLTTRGILFAEGKKWLGIRTACEPLFHSSTLSSYAPMMHAAADQLVDKLQAAAGSGEGVNVSDLLKAMSLDVIGSTVFGVDFRAQKEGDGSQMVWASEAMFHPTGGFSLPYVFLSFIAPSLRRLASWLAIWQGSGTIREVIAARRYLWGAAQALLDSARKQPAAAPATTAGGVEQDTKDGRGGSNGGNASGAAGAGSTGRAPLDESLADVSKLPAECSSFQRSYAAFASCVPPPTSIVSRLKDAVNKQTGQQLTDLDICAQLFTFLLAGYETTSLALSFALYELAKHPRMQQRIAEEVGALGRGHSIGYDDLAKLPFTEAAFLEAMRLYPPVSSIIALARAPKAGGADVTVPTGGDDGGTGATYHIPEGTRVQLNVWAIHRDPRHYPEPEQYRPERFMPGSAEAAARHPGAFFPFGLGPRKCVGYRFALEESVLCLARLLQRFEVRLEPARHSGPLNLMTGVTLVPEGGIWLRVYDRQ